MKFILFFPAFSTLLDTHYGNSVKRNEKIVKEKELKMMEPPMQYINTQNHIYGFRHDYEQSGEYWKVNLIAFRQPRLCLDSAPTLPPLCLDSAWCIHSPYLVLVCELGIKKFFEVY